MKFNYFKQAKENGHSDLAFKYARILKYEYGDRCYMAANWLAWSYTCQRMGLTGDAREYLKAFLYEIARICEN